MHPQIVRNAAGSCPICGMALEPMTPQSGRRRQPRTCRHDPPVLGRGWAVAPLLVMAMADDMAKPALDALMAPRTAVWIQLILGTPAVLWCGWPFFVRGWQSVVNRSLNMFTLIALGTGVAYFYSLVAAVFPGIFPASFRSPMGGVPLYSRRPRSSRRWCCSARCSNWRARSQTSSAIRALLDLAPKHARFIKDDGAEEDIALRRRGTRPAPAGAPGREGAGRRGRDRGRSSIDESMISANRCRSRNRRATQ